MRKGRVLGGLLVILAVAAGAAGYVEQRPLIAWYHTVQESVQGAKSEKGAKGLYYCPMHPSFTSDRPGDCAICGMSLVKKTAADAPAGEQKAGQGGKKILYYRNPMNPQITSPVPMKDEMGMDYVPVYAEKSPQAHPGVYISPQKQQLIGVKKGKVQMRQALRPDPDRRPGGVRPQSVRRPAGVSADAERPSVCAEGQPETTWMSSRESLLEDMRYKLLLLGMSDAEIEDAGEAGQARNQSVSADPRRQERLGVRDDLRIRGRVWSKRAWPSRWTRWPTRARRSRAGSSPSRLCWRPPPARSKRGPWWTIPKASSSSRCLPMSGSTTIWARSWRCPRTP